MYLGSDGYAELQQAAPTIIRLAFQNCRGCNFSVATAGWPERHPSVSEEEIIDTRIKAMGDNPHTAIVIDMFLAKRSIDLG